MSANITKVKQEFDKEIIEFIVEMSDRYIQGRFPDKALAVSYTHLTLPSNREV